MSPFRLEISDHAAARFRERGITRQLVRACIAYGDVGSVDLSGRLVCEWSVRRKILVVVYIEVKGGVLVVTAYWKE
jgi:hypothetical protein